jgi:putative transposase
MSRWPHAPVHALDAKGALMITASTYRKIPHFNSRAKLDRLQDTLFDLAAKHGFSLQAWAIFPNHYHFLAHFEQPTRLAPFVQQLHASTAIFVNGIDKAPCRQVWFQYWDKNITFESSYFSRLHYVHRNAVHHGVVKDATRYPWCSAAWFERESPVSFRETVYSFPIDRIKVADAFEVKREDFTASK